MPLYVTLMKYTTEGIKGISPERRQQLHSNLASHGGRYVAGYALFGAWDALTVTEFPDEKSAMQSLVALGKMGIFTTQTMSAMPMEEFVNLAQNA
jgi:uncharacterized protein with GYD domain